MGTRVLTSARIVTIELYSAVAVYRLWWGLGTWQGVSGRREVTDAFGTSRRQKRASRLQVYFLLGVGDRSAAREWLSVFFC